MAVTPNYSWPVPVATDFVKDGWEAISDLGNAIDTTVAGLGSGLTRLNTASFSAQTSVIVDSVFTSTFRNYKVVLNITASVSDVALSIYYRSGSPAADTTTGYNSQLLRAFGTSLQAAAGADSTVGNNSNASTNYTNIELNIYNPNVAATTSLRSVGTWFPAGSSRYINDFFTTQSDITQFTGFKIFPASGNITGQIITYGLDD
jgi:hypothetical protein